MPSAGARAHDASRLRRRKPASWPRSRARSADRAGARGRSLSPRPRCLRLMASADSAALGWELADVAGAQRALISSSGPRHVIHSHVPVLHRALASRALADAGSCRAARRDASASRRQSAARCGSSSRTCRLTVTAPGRSRRPCATCGGSARSRLRTRRSSSTFRARAGRPSFR